MMEKYHRPPQFGGCTIQGLALSVSGGLGFMVYGFAFNIGASIIRIGFAGLADRSLRRVLKRCLVHH